VPGGDGQEPFQDGGGGLGDQARGEPGELGQHDGGVAQPDPPGADRVGDRAEIGVTGDPSDVGDPPRVGRRQVGGAVQHPVGRRCGSGLAHHAAGHGLGGDGDPRGLDRRGDLPHPGHQLVQLRVVHPGRVRGGGPEHPRRRGQHLPRLEFVGPFHAFEHTFDH
jgi:hypothetical protein